MHLHTAIISYNRPDLLKRCVESYLETVSIPYSWLVVDNGSDEETLAWLTENVSNSNVLYLGENKYPGFATNRGWERLPHETTLLHRSDNDFVYLPNWCEEVLGRFADGNFGQVGLRTNQEELYAQWNVGGNNVIKRELWDAGLRYDERPWGHYPPGMTEDSYFSPAVQEMGWEWTRVRKPCIQSISSGDWNDPYYAQSYGIRGIKRPHTRSK